MITIRQECRSLGGFQEIPVPSRSKPEVVHRVLIHAGNKNRSICDCEGFRFRGHCQHIESAWGFRCEWHEGKALRQTDQQRIDHVCPDCLGETIMVMINE